MAQSGLRDLRWRGFGLVTLFVAMSGIAFAIPVRAQAPTPPAPTPTLQTDRACYSPGEAVRLTGGGYTPGGQVGVDISLSGERGNRTLSRSEPLVADATGAISDFVGAPELASRDVLRETATLTANDQARAAANPGSPPLAGVARFTLSAFTVGVDNQQWRPPGRIANPQRLTHFRLLGFAPATRAWAHYRFGGRTVKTVPLGALAGSCGHLNKRMREFPFRPVRGGAWTVAFSGTPRFDPRLAHIRFSVRVPRARAVPLKPPTGRVPESPRVS